MDLLDRYIKAVKSYLPKAQQDDIIRELAANIQAQMDDRATELGRPLTDAEQEAILQSHGHPMLVAGRYQTAWGTLVFGRQLIGATLFPFYVKVLWFTLELSLITHVIVIVALFFGGNPTTFGGVMTEIVFQITIQFVVITGIFAAMEQYLPTMTWNAQRPPTLTQAFPKVRQSTRLESVAQIIVLAILAVWLRFIFDRPEVLLGPAAATYRLGPIWYDVALPTVLIVVVSIMQGAINLIRPDWVQLRQTVRVATDIGSLGIMVYLLRATGWIVLAHPTDTSTALGPINHYIAYGLWIAVLSTLVIIAVDSWRWLRSWQGSSAQS
ncbi:MAG: hypothetical protein H0X24_13860 [Ktedonobacterales bacterium]|nr:hypothetical protein [Ktedonobacterales bacterium]